MFAVASATACDPMDPINYRQAAPSYFLASPLSPAPRENGMFASLTAGRMASQTILPGIPTDEELRDAKPAVSERIEAWISANPVLAQRFPANALLSSIGLALKQR